MAKVLDLIQSVSDAADQATARVQTDVANLKQQIADLEAQIAAQGEATPEQEAALTALKAKVDAIDPTNPATIPAA